MRDVCRCHELGISDQKRREVFEQKRRFLEEMPFRELAGHLALHQMVYTPSGLCQACEDELFRMDFRICGRRLMEGR